MIANPTRCVDRVIRPIPPASACPPPPGALDWSSAMRAEMGPPAINGRPHRVIARSGQQVYRAPGGLNSQTLCPRAGVRWPV